jgi:hypothetical protein
MRFGANVSVEDLKDFSIHSFRIFVACALLAANVPRQTIKRLHRWRGDLSLEIYARLNNGEWATHVASTYTAKFGMHASGRQDQTKETTARPGGSDERALSPPWRGGRLVARRRGVGTRVPGDSLFRSVS